MPLVDDIKTALDELRMQMLGLQVLFGFQFQGLFQAGFRRLSSAPRIIDAIGLMLLLFALSILVAIPCQHRIVDQGESTPRLFTAAQRAANAALLPLAAAIGCNVLVATSATFGTVFAGTVAFSAVGVALLGWFALPRMLRKDAATARRTLMETSKTPLRAKIEQMLTEARVILPGVQALLGFQMIVMLTPAFAELPIASRYTHVTALLCNLFAIVLLISPAAVHRLTFDGTDQPRMHAIGSALVTMALAPMAVSIALDLYVALDRLFDSTDIAIGCAVPAFLLMVVSWYGMPLGMKRRLTSGP